MVDKQMEGLRIERFDRWLHGGSGGGQQAYIIDFPGGGFTDAYCHRNFPDIPQAALTGSRRELF